MQAAPGYGRDPATSSSFYVCHQSDQILLVIVHIKGMLHVRRSHPESGQKTDCKEIHYKQRDEFPLGMKDLSDCIGQ